MSQTTYCPNCGTRIIWLRTRAGRNIPVDADTVKPSHAYYLPKIHRAHFATCRRFKIKQQETSASHKSETP